MINDQLSRNSPGDICTQILFDHGQCEVDARSHPSRGPHRAVGDENAVLLHLHFWKPSLQFSCAVPMRRRTTAVQQTCFGQHERAGARRSYSPRSPQTPAQKLDHPWRQRSSHDAAADQQGVEFPVVERLPPPAPPPPTPPPPPPPPPPP